MRKTGTRSRSRRRGGVASSSRPPPPEIYDPPELQQYRRPLASFIRDFDVASGSNHGRFYLLRTNGWKSLAQNLGLPHGTYSSLLLACRLVQVKAQKVVVNKEEWKSFLSQYGLKGEMEPETASLTSDLQIGGVYKDSLDNKNDKEELGERGKDMPFFKDMHLIRIGKIPEGGKVIAGQREINFCLEPPRNNRNMLRAKATLNNDISQLMISYELNHPDDVQVVKDWVLMKESTKPTEVPKSNEAHGSSDTDPITSQTPTRPTRAEVSDDDGDGCDAGSKRFNLGSTGVSPMKKKPTMGKHPQEEDDVDDDEVDAGAKRFNPGPTGVSPKKKRPTLGDIDSGQLEIPDIIREKFPKMSGFSMADNVALMDAEQAEALLNEMERAVERVHREDLPPELAKMFPTLAKYFPEGLVTGSRVTQAGSSVLDKDEMITGAVVRELFNLRKAQDRPLRVEHANGKVSELIALPLTKKRGEPQKPNFDMFLNNLFASEAVNDESVEIIVGGLLDCLLSGEYKDVTMEQLRQRQIAPEVMDEFQSAATIDAGGLKIWQWRVVQKCLRLYMNVEQVAVSEHKMRAIGGEDSDITYGVYQNPDPEDPDKVGEEIKYWTKDPVSEFIRSVEGMINGYELDPDEIERINICFGGDHGKEKFRFAAKVLLRMNSGEYYDDVFGLADVACRKDSPVVLDNTCMPTMTIGMNEIEDGSLVFTKEGDEYSIDLVEASSVAVEEDDGDRIVIEPTAYLSGDLLFLAYMMGKENFSSAWCNWCSLTKDEWQDEACIPVDEAKLWTVDRIGEQVEKNTNAGYPPSAKKTDPKMMGVRRKPICKIPFERVIFAVLHAAIGIGNNLIDYF